MNENEIRSQIQNLQNRAANVVKTDASKFAVNTITRVIGSHEADLDEILENVKAEALESSLKDLSERIAETETVLAKHEAKFGAVTDNDDPLGLNTTAALFGLAADDTTTFSFSASEFEAEQRKSHLVRNVVTIEGDAHVSGYTTRIYPRTRMEMLELWSKVL